VGTTAEPSHSVSLLSPFLRYRLPQHECGYTCGIYLCKVCRNEGCQSWLEGSESQAYGLGIQILDSSAAKNFSLRGDSRENLQKFRKGRKSAFKSGFSLSGLFGTPFASPTSFYPSCFFERQTVSGIESWGDHCRYLLQPSLSLLCIPPINETARYMIFAENRNVLYRYSLAQGLPHPFWLYYTAYLIFSTACETSYLQPPLMTTETRCRTTPFSLIKCYQRHYFWWFANNPSDLCLTRMAQS
jgi:hypothetical protein